MTTLETLFTAKLNRLLKAAIILTFTISPAAFAGGMDSGGGNACLLEIKALQDDVLKATDQLVSLQQAGVDKKEFKKTLTDAHFDIGKNLTKDGAPVDALNFPALSLIRLDEDRCGEALKTLTSGMALLTHETLGLMKVNDAAPDFKISKNVLNELSKIVVAQGKPNWNFVCTVKRWHSSGLSGWEILGVADTYQAMPGISLTSRRDDGKTNGYYLQLSTSSGPYFEEETALQYTLYLDPKGDTSKRRFIAPATKDEPWVDIQFKDQGKTSIKLLDWSDLNGDGYVQMDCYRSI
jgi:hypothetical protein